MEIQRNGAGPKGIGPDVLNGQGNRGQRRELEWKQDRGEVEADREQDRTKETENKESEATMKAAREWTQEEVQTQQSGG